MDLEGEGGAWGSSRSPARSCCPDARRETPQQPAVPFKILLTGAWAEGYGASRGEMEGGWCM